jgi:hypothetical protein
MGIQPVPPVAVPRPTSGHRSSAALACGNTRSVPARIWIVAAAGDRKRPIWHRIRISLLLSQISRRGARRRSVDGISP